MSTAPEKTAIMLMDWWPQQPAKPQLTDTRSLLPLIDKPMLQLAVEGLVRLSCQRLHVLLGEQPTPAREFLESGERWGIRIDYHYVNVDLDLAQNLRPLALNPTQHYWLVCPEMLPGNLAMLSDNTSFAGSALCWRSSERVHWSGWGYFTGAWLAGLHVPALYGKVERLVVDDKHISLRLTAQPISSSSDADFLRSSLQALQARSELSGKTTHVARGAVVHPSVTIDGLVSIGQHARIEAGVKLGPNVIVCDGAVVGQGSELSDSIVLPDTYVGAQLELKQAIVAPGRLSSIANDVVLNSVESGFLASINGQGDGWPISMTAFLAAWWLKLLLLPLWLAAFLLSRLRGLKSPFAQTMYVPRTAHDSRGGRHVKIHVANTRAVVTSPETHGLWLMHFLYTFYPGLNELARGNVAFSGPELRSVVDIAKLPENWKWLYRRHQCGLISESLLLNTDANSSHARYACDAYAVTHDAGRHALRLLSRYLGRVCADGCKLFFHPKRGRWGRPLSSNTK